MPFKWGLLPKLYYINKYPKLSLHPSYLGGTAFGFDHNVTSKWPLDDLWLKIPVQACVHGVYLKFWILSHNSVCIYDTSEILTSNVILSIKKTFYAYHNFREPVKHSKHFENIFASKCHIHTCIHTPIHTHHHHCINSFPSDKYWKWGSTWVSKAWMSHDAEMGGGALFENLIWNCAIWWLLEHNSLTLKWL